MWEFLYTGDLTPQGGVFQLLGPVGAEFGSQPTKKWLNLRRLLQFNQAHMVEIGN